MALCAGCVFSMFLFAGVRQGEVGRAWDCRKMLLSIACQVL